MVSVSDCLFCRIVKGELPAYKTYEDALFLGFLDIKPLARGNSLLIPKKHYRWVTDVVEFAAYWQKAKLLSLATQKVVGADYISFLTLGTEVPHAHIRIIPRWYTDTHREGIDMHHVETIAEEEQHSLALKIYKLTI